MLKNLCISCIKSVAVATCFLGLAGSAEAAPLDSMFQGTGTFASIGKGGASFDDQKFNVFNAVLPFTTGEIHTIKSFTPTNEVEITAAVFAQNGAYSAAGLDEIGFLDGTGSDLSTFSAIIPTGAGLGFAGSTILNPQQQKTLAIRSPEGTFAADGGPDGTHMIAFQITKPGELFFPFATLFGAQFLAQIHVGDWLILCEDLWNTKTNKITGTKGDQDFNDLVIVIRGSETVVPEPATLALLGGASLFGLRLRRKKLAA